MQIRMVKEGRFWIAERPIDLERIRALGLVVEAFWGLELLTALAKAKGFEVVPQNGASEK